MIKGNRKKIIYLFIICLLLIPILNYAQDTKTKWRNLLTQVEELYKKRKYKAAEEIAEEALVIAKQDFGTDSLEAAESLFTLGAMKKIQYKDEEAETLYAKARAIRAKHAKSLNPLGLHTEVFFDRHFRESDKAKNARYFIAVSILLLVALALTIWLLIKKSIGNKIL